MCLTAGKIIAFVLCAWVVAILVFVADILNREESFINGSGACLLKCSCLIQSNTSSPKQQADLWNVPSKHRRLLKDLEGLKML